GDASAALDRFTTLSVAAGYLGTEDFLKFIHNAEAGVKEKPWFEGRGAMAILAIVLVGGLALNLTPCVLPMIPINLGIIGAGTRGGGSRKRGFLLGAIAALLAGACVAPVVLQVILFSSALYAKGVAAALALPFLLGVGMAIPWPIAGAGIAALPKPGAWMVRVKQAFGAFILAMAA